MMARTRLPSFQQRLDPISFSSGVAERGKRHRLQPPRERRWLVALSLALALGGCASRAARIEGALVKAGVSGRMAACLAPRLADRLSNDQLRALAAAARRPGGETGPAGPREIVARVAGIGDPQIVEVVSSAGLHCVMKG